MSFIDELNNLDPSRPGLWPAPIKLLVFLALFVAISYAAWKFFVTPLREEIASLREQEAQQVEVLEGKQKQAANLEPLREQMREMEQSFGEMVRQLPDKTAVEALLVDISQTGLSAGLEFKLFKPGAPVLSDFYSTLPIQLQVYGKYHEIGEFVSGLAALPRIVTVHDVKIGSAAGIALEGAAAQSQKLSLTATAKTYQAIESDDDGAAGDAGAADEAGG